MDARAVSRKVKEEIARDPVLAPLSTLAKETKICLYVVGGYLRDLLLGTRRNDYDVSLAKEAASSISGVEEKLGVSFFKVGKEETDTVTFRVTRREMSLDLTFLQGRGIEEDLQRRDFTVNAFAYSLRDETFHHVERALGDLRDRVIRAVTDRSIDQDPLRMLRAARYLCTLDGFRLDPALTQEISAKRDLIRKVPAERIRMELDRILLSPLPEAGLKVLCTTSLLFDLFPGLRGLEGLGQSERHHLNVLSHTLLVIEKIRSASGWVTHRDRYIPLSSEDRLALSYAALFHDLGKQDTYSKGENGSVHFYRHEAHSCDRASAAMDVLRFSNLLRHRVLRLIQNHMRILNLSEVTSETALRRLVHQVGEETPLLVLHTLADKEASRGILSFQNDALVEDLCLQILALFEEKDLVRPPPLVTGHDVMALGYPSGPRIGKILREIRQKQVEGEIRTREEALRYLGERYGRGTIS